MLRANEFINCENGKCRWDNVLVFGEKGMDVRCCAKIEQQNVLISCKSMVYIGMTKFEQLCKN